MPDTLPELAVRYTAMGAIPPDVRLAVSSQFPVIFAGEGAGME
jgi:hypothetical protein